MASENPGRCMICSYAKPYHKPQVPIYHRHFSSLRLRELTGAESNNTTSYLCPSCMSHHVPYPKTSTKLVISDSTLHSSLLPPEDITRPGPIQRYGSDTLHVDYLTIGGGDLESLTNAFRLDYDRSDGMSLDVCIVAGYNDLVKVYCREYILYNLLHLRDNKV